MDAPSCSHLCLSAMGNVERVNLLEQGYRHVGAYLMSTLPHTAILKQNPIIITCLDLESRFIRSNQEPVNVDILNYTDQTINVQYGYDRKDREVRLLVGDKPVCKLYNSCQVIVFHDSRLDQLLLRIGRRHYEKGTKRLENYFYTLKSMLGWEKDVNKLEFKCDPNGLNLQIDLQDRIRKQFQSSQPSFHSLNYERKADLLLLLKTRDLTKDFVSRMLSIPYRSTSTELGSVKKMIYFPFPGEFPDFDASFRAVLPVLTEYAQEFLTTSQDFGILSQHIPNEAILCKEPQTSLFKIPKGKDFIIVNHTTHHIEIDVQDILLIENASIEKFHAPSIVVAFHKENNPWSVFFLSKSVYKNDPVQEFNCGLSWGRARGLD